MENPSEEQRFSANVQCLTELVHELTSICWDAGVKQINPILISLAGGYLSGIDKVQLIETFINNTENDEKHYWDEIKNRNEKFFIEHTNEVFGKLPVEQGNIDAFKMLFTAVDADGESIISDDDKTAVWDMFGSLIKICIKYVHRVRDCYLFEKEGRMVPRYRYNKFPAIKVREHAKKWDIDLEIPKV